MAPIAAYNRAVARTWMTSGAGRLVRVWRTLPHDRRLAAYAALGLFLALFLPWYQETVIASGKATHLQSASASITGWGAFSFVEAAVLLVAAGVLTLLFQRAEGRAFHLPGGDGWVIMAAGLWTCLLIVWRIFDKTSTSVHGPGATTSGIEWGIFVALAVAIFLTYAGSRIRAAHQPEPPLPGEGDGPAPGAPPADRPRRAARRSSSSRPSAGRGSAAAPADHSARRQVRPPRPVPADGPPRRKRLGWEDPPAWEDHTTTPDAVYEPPPRRPIPDHVPAEQAPPTAGAEDASPTLPLPDASPTLPLPDASPTLPLPDASPTLPLPDASPTLPLPEPSTQAGRKRSHDDPAEQLTIPLEPERDDD
jgi:hypothetical protein